MIRSSLEIALEKKYPDPTPAPGVPPEPVVVSQEELDWIAAEGRCERCGHLHVAHGYVEDWGVECYYNECDCKDWR